MDEAEMVEELKKRGYRVHKPAEPKPAEEFKPFKAIHKESSSLREVEVVEEKPKTVVIRDIKDNFKLNVSKGMIYEFDQEAIDKYKEMWKRQRELDKQADKERDEAWEFIDVRLKHKYVLDEET